MAHPYSRKQRVADQIHRELAELLLAANDIRFHAIGITDVDVSPDLKNAKIYFSSRDEANVKELTAALNKASGFFRHHLADRMDMRITPQIEFVFDQTLQKAERLGELLGKIPDKPEDDSH